MTNHICSFPDCGRPQKAKTLCMTHYQQQRAGKPLAPIWKQPRGSECSFDGCAKPVQGRGLCAGHLAQRPTARPRLSSQSTASFTPIACAGAEASTCN